MMNNVIPINRGKKVKGLAPKVKDLVNKVKGFIPEDSYFWTGVFTSVILPQAVFFVYGGELALVAFALTATAGTAWGLARYYRPSQQFLFHVGAGPAARVPPRPAGVRKKAA